MAQQIQVQETNIKEEENLFDCGYRLYAEGHLNWTYSANEDLRYMKQFVFKSSAYAGDFGLGYTFNDIWGIYADVSWNRNKSAAHPKNNFKIGDIKDYHFSSFEPSISCTYNLSNGIGGYKPGRRNNWFLTFGPSMAFRGEITNYPDEYAVENDGKDLKKKVFFGGALGFNYVYIFNNWISFSAHAVGHVFHDTFNGRKCASVYADGRINVGAGIRVYLTPSTKPVRERVYMDDVRVSRDTIRVKQVVDVRDIDVYPIPFETNKSDLASAQTKDLKTVADILNKYPNRVVYVLGYADKNTEADNAIELAKNRAEVITNELIDNYGIDETRVITHKIGTQEQPYLKQAERNRSTICIIATSTTSKKH